MMRTAPAFWARPPGLLSELLLPFGAGWDAAGRLRQTFARPYCAPVPVACVGNLVAGGSGKTPVALALASHLVSRGIAVHIVTRGYGGRLGGPVRVDRARHDAAAVGDEALLLAARAPCWVARDRADGVRAAVAAGAQMVVLDDGFQNPGIAKTVSFLVVDAAYGFGNGRVIPAGPLRENPARGLARADAVVLLGADARPGCSESLGIGKALRILHAVLRPIAGERFAGVRVLAFAGIGRPVRFFATLRALGAELVGTRSFPDHHPYRSGEIDRLFRAAARARARLITTAKDIVRVPVAMRAAIEVLEVEIRWADPAAPAELLRTVVGDREATLIHRARRAWSPSPRCGRGCRPSEVGEGTPLRPRQPIGFTHQLEGWGAALCFGALGLLPIDWASAIGGALARTIGPRLGISKRARLNIGRALPWLSEAEIEHIIAGIWDNLGRVAAEYPHLHQIRVFEPGGRVETHGVEHIDRAVAAGRRMIIFSGHIANWEIAMLAAVQYGISVAQIYRAANNPLVDRIINRFRGSSGELIPKGTVAARRAIAVLRRGEHLTMLADQKMNDGIPVPFFGRTAMTSSALASLALRFDCDVLPARVERLGGAHFRLTVFPPLPLPRSGDRHADVAALMARVNQILECWIRDRPAEWFWLHRRWPD